MDIIGIDIGFGFTKATNGKQFLIFKSIFGEATLAQFNDSIVTTPGGDGHLQIEVDGNPYFVGELAEQQSAERFFTLDHKQFVNNYTKILAMAAVAQLQGGESIKLVLGLPVSYYQQHKQELISILKGRHQVAIIDGKYNRNNITVNIADVQVVPQPLGSAFNLMFNHMGGVAEKRFLNEKVAVIDVGFLTTDYTIMNNAVYSERGSLTVDTGISRAFTHIANRLKEKTGTTVELYRLYEAVEKGSIKIRGKRSDIQKLTEQSFKQLATTIATDANRLWINDWDIDAILITGGGGAVLLPYLQPLLEGYLLPVNMQRDFRFNNVRGFCKYGKYLASRETEAEVETNV